MEHSRIRRTSELNMCIQAWLATMDEEFALKAGQEPPRKATRIRNTARRPVKHALTTIAEVDEPI